MKTNPNFILRKIYGKFILMPIHANSVSEDPISLEGVAPEIWDLASQECSYEEITEILVSKYQLERFSEEENAIRNFLDMLIGQELILE